MAATMRALLIAVATLFALLHAGLTHPIAAADKCRTGCHGTPTNFKYAEGTTYKYNLESSVDITLSTAEGQQSATKVKATVLLSQQPQCVQVLRVQNLQIFGGDGKKKGSIPNIEKPIKLNFHDGHLEDIICAEHGDTQVSLNIKRAVASLFQAALKHTTETDVFGVCPTSISTHKDASGATTFTKTRTLNRCSHRESAKHDFLTTAFNLHSEIKSSPILKSDYTSEMRLKDGVVDHVLVTESYLYMPFSVGKNGVRASVATKLQLAGKSKDAPKTKCTEPKSIIFENPHPMVADKSDVKTILDAVKDTANSIKETVSSKTANKFGQLIAVMAAGKKDDLLAVYNQVQSGAGFADKEKGKKVFLDALFRAGTGDCLEVSIQLLKSKQLSALEEKMVYLGMSFIRHATPESITTATGLLDGAKVPREAYLGIGTLAAHYCRQHDCHNMEATKTLSAKLLAKLKDGKAANRDQENEMISVLKSLTNMKHLADNVVPKIVAIAQDKKNSMRLRVTALEAFHADACKDKLRDSALGILKDTQQDSEVRIKAYLALAECPNGKIAAALKTILENEPSYQVGGFIVSHIRHLRASANPDHELAKHELGAVNTLKQFPVDPRKYSFANELSYTMNTLGTSAAVESHVIYSQHSFLPRSTHFNLTTEVFGHKINVLEVDARQENLDDLMEHYLGPLGVLRNKDPEELMKSGKASLGKIMEHLKERVQKTRSKRNVPKSEIDAVGKAVQIKTNELNTDLDLDLSIKLFGSEFLFLSLNNNLEEFTADKLIDEVFNCIDGGIEKAKNYQHTFTRNGVFLDAELAYPTASGFPLKLSVEGTDAVQLVAHTQMDIKALLQGSKQGAMQVKLIPSANLELAGRLTLDASVVESGLKTMSTLHTATGGALTFEVFANGLDAKFSLPIEKQEIINADHQLVFVTRDAGHGEVDTPMKFVESRPLDICFDQLDPVIGLTFCAALNSPNQQINTGTFLPYPLNGNAQLNVFITRSQPITYHIRDVLHHEDKKGFEFVVETLDASQKPMVSLNVEGFAYPEKYIRASLDSPIKKAMVEARLVDADGEKSIGAKFVHDTQEYSGKLGLTVSGNAAKSTYKPLIEFVTPEQGKQQGPYTVEGQVIAEKSGEDAKYTFDNVKLIAPNLPAPITISGSLGRTGGAYFTDLKLDDGSNNAALKSKLQANPNLIKVDAKFTNTMSPVSNFHVDYELKRDDSSISDDLTVVHGGDLTSKQNTLKMKNSITRKYTDPSDYQFTTKNSFSYPLLGVEGKFNVNKVPKSFDYNIEGKYNKAKIASKMTAKYNQKTTGDYDVNLDAEILENKLKAKAKRDIHGHVSTIDNSLEVNDKKAEVKGTITHKCKPYDTDIGCDLTIQVPQCPDVIGVKHSFTHVPEHCKTMLKINKGSENLVDFALDAHKTKGGNGHLKANIKELVSVDGELKADNWNGRAHLLIDVVKVQRKLKLDGTFNLMKPKYSIAANFYPDFEKSPKKISLTSENEVADHSVDSKNKLDIFENTIEANMKGHLEGTPFNGKCNGEADLTLPNGMYFMGKLNREASTDKDGLMNGNAFVNVEQRKNKNTPGRKLTLKAEVKNTNLKERKVDVVYNLAIDDSNGKNLNGDLTVKYDRTADSNTADVNGKLYGSVLTEPMEFHQKAAYKNRVGTYSLSSKCSRGSMKLDGQYDLSGANPMTSAVTFDMKTTNPKLKQVTFSASGKYQKDEHKCEVGGKTKLFIDDDGTEPEATVDFEVEGDVTLGHHAGAVKGSVHCHKHDPVTLAIGYGHKEENGVMKCQADASLKYAEGKTLKADASLIRPNDNEGKLELKLETPYEHAKKADLALNYKKDDEAKHYTADAVAHLNDKKFNGEAEVKVSKTEPLLRLELTHDGHTDKIYVKNQVISDHVQKGEVQIHHKDFIYDYTQDLMINSIEDFSIRCTLNAPTMNAKNIVYEFKNNKNKVIEILITQEGEVVIKGNTNYKVRDEAGKYIVEGSGEFTLKNDKKSGNFKFIRQALTMDKHHELGESITLDAAIGTHAIDTEFKLTNKQFRYANSYCKEKKQCQHVEIDAKTNVIDLMEYNNEVEISCELASYSFGAKAVTKRKQLQFDHTTDVHFQTKDNKKYQYSLYIHPKESGVSFTTPQRQVSLESHIDIAPKFKGPTKFEIALYLDKTNAPTKKTSLSGGIEHAGSEKSGKITAEMKLSSPGLSKDLAVAYNSKYDVANHQTENNLILDIFAQQNNKIVATSKMHATRNVDAGKFSLEHHGSVKSLGMDLDIGWDEIVYQYDSKAHAFKTMSKLTMNMGDHKCTCLSLFEINPSKMTAKLQLHNKEMFDVEANMKLSKDQQVIDTEAHVVGVKPMVSHFELKNYNTLKYTLGPKDNAAKKLTVNAAFIPGQIADFRADVNQQELVKASVQLDEANFLKPDYAFNVDNVQNLLLVPAKKELEHAMKEGKTLLTDAGKDMSGSLKHMAETAKKNAPNFKGVKDYYTGEWEKIAKEVGDDPYIQKVNEALHKAFDAVAKVVKDLVTRAVEVLEEVTKTLKATITKLTTAWETEIWPQLKTTLEKLYEFVHHTFESISEIVFALMAQVSQFMDAHQEELKQIATTLSTISQDLGRFLQKNYERARAILTENFQKVYEELKALPIYDELKARYEMLIKDVGDWSEPLKHMIDDALTTLQDIVPSEDGKKIVEAFRGYIAKKLKQEPVDDFAAIEGIIRQVIALLKKLSSQYRIKDLQMIDTQSMTIDYLYALPRLVAARFSPLTYLTLREGPWSSLKESMYGMSFNPRSFIGPPFRMYAYTVQGQHIFTFDGKHVTFPGACNYLLVRDAMNGNFTVGGTYANGQLTALTYADATDSVTIKKGGQLMHNKAAAEFPVRVNRVEVFRSYHHVYIYSKAGIEITCDPQLVVCKYSVSGFYHGQLRGLLGNANNEPYDDFTIPNGKIVTSESDFGNAYKMTPTCKPVATVDHHTHHRAPTCTELFTASNTLRVCYPFVNPETYRMACDHGVAAGVKDTEEAVAKGYVAACNAKFIPAVLPEKYMKCLEHGDEAHAVGDKFSVKLPAKAADVVLIVDQAKSNEVIYKELVQPLVADLTKELAAKGITDVEFHLVGYGGEYQKWPSHFTNNGKLSWKGKLPAMHFSEAPVEEPCHTGSAKLDTALAMVKAAKKDVDLALGLDIQARAFYESYRYPFRAHATKTIVAFNAQPCRQGKLLMMQKLRALLFNDKNVHINMVTPFEEFKVRDAKVTKTVVGFDATRVLVFGDAKKKSPGSVELHKELEFDDFCSDFLVKRQDGAVFNADNFVAAKAPQRTQFAQVMAHTLVMQAADTEQGLDCECSMRGFDRARAVCKSVFINHKEQK